MSRFEKCALSINSEHVGIDCPACLRAAASRAALQARVITRSDLSGALYRLAVALIIRADRLDSRRAAESRIGRLVN